MGVAEDYQIFKSALVYTVTFRITQNLVQHPQHTDGDFVALLVCAFVATSMLQLFGSTLERQRESTHLLVRPVASAGLFVVQMLTSAGINMMSNLTGSYISRMFDTDRPLYLAISSSVGILLVWVLGVAVGAPLR